MIDFWNAVAIAGMILAAVTYYKEHFHVKDFHLPRQPLVFYPVEKTTPSAAYPKPPTWDEAFLSSDWSFGYCPRCKQMHAQNPTVGRTCL